MVSNLNSQKVYFGEILELLYILLTLPLIFGSNHSDGKKKGKLNFFQILRAPYKNRTNQSQKTQPVRLDGLCMLE